MLFVLWAGLVEREMDTSTRVAITEPQIPLGALFRLDSTTGVIVSPEHIHDLPTKNHARGWNPERAGFARAGEGHGSF
jgi:hypothetical protein